MTTTRLLRSIARQLRYRQLSGLIGERLQIRSADAVEPDILHWLLGKFPWTTGEPLRLVGPDRECMAGAAAKYGLLDLTFAVNGVTLDETDAPGLALLREYGFLGEKRPEEEDYALDADDPSCLTELCEDLEKGETVLRLFLNDSGGDYLKRLCKSGEAKALTEGRKTFAQIINQYWPNEFVVRDACLTNARFIWFHKHFYL